VRIAEVIEAMRQIRIRSRQDHMAVQVSDAKSRTGLPPIALIGSMRKFTS
jgi:hypothetical protein